MRIEKRHLKVFLEGYLIDVNNVVLSEMENAPTTAQIILPPTARAINLLPKTLCHVFYLNKNEYVLIFEGELAGISFEKNAGQKNCLLTFSSLTTNWRNHYIRSADANAEITFDQCAFLMLNGNTSLGSLEDTSTSHASEIAMSKVTVDLDYYKYNTAFTLFQLMGWNFLPNQLDERGNIIHRRITDSQDVSSEKFDYIVNKIYELAGNNDPNNVVVTITSDVVDKLYVDDKFIQYQFELFDIYCRNQLGQMVTKGGTIPWYDPGFRLDFFHRYNGTAASLNTYAIPAFRLCNFFAEQTGELNECPVVRTVTTDNILKYYKNTRDNFSLGELVSKMNSVSTTIDCSADSNQGVGSREEFFDWTKYKDLKYGSNPDFVFPHWANFVTSVPKAVMLTILQMESKGNLHNVANKLARLRKARASGVEEKEVETQKSSNFWLSYLLTTPNDNVDSISRAVTILEGLSQTSADINVTIFATQILQALEELSPYYAMLAQTLKLRDRIFTFSSVGAYNLLKNRSVLQWLVRTAQGNITSITSATDLLSMIGKYINYQLVEVGAPFLKDGNLTSAVFTPDTVFMPPINCNIFFPDQTVDFAYNRDLVQEPTRMISFSNAMKIAVNDKGETSWDTFLGYATPRLGPMVRTGPNSAVHRYSREECYRGINPAMASTDQTPFEAAVLDLFRTVSGQNRDQAPTLAETANSLNRNSTTVSGFFSDFFTGVIDGMYLRGRYAPRGGMLTSVYDPNRLCGFPALVLDDELPSVVGKINSIQSTISADGQSQSLVKLTYCRTYYDSTIKNDPVIPTISNATTYQESLSVSGYDSPYDLATASQIENDVVPDTTHAWRWMENDKYHWSTIGKNIYGKTFSSGILDFSIYNWADPKLVQLPNSSIADLNNNAPLYYAQDGYNFTIATQNAITNLKNYYNKISLSDRNAISDVIIKRNLITYDQYWELVTNNRPPNHSDNYRNAFDLQNIHTLLQQEIKGLVSFDDAKKVLDDKLGAYSGKPFTSERLTRVLAYLQQWSHNKEQ